MTDVSSGIGLRTAESVAAGHPDKLADQISDSVLDAYLAGDPRSRVAVETALSGNEVWVFGEVTSDAIVNIELIVRDLLRSVGYERVEDGIDPEGCDIRVSIKHQSADIARGIGGERLGAGDQGIIYGYATDEHPSYLPLPLVYAHKIVKMLPALRNDGIPLLPDGKAQVTFADLGSEQMLAAVVLSAQHHEVFAVEDLRWVMEKVLEDMFVSDGIDFSRAVKYINPAGRFVIGGPTGDAGLTGRKLAVDTYGGIARHGGGAFSGKDPTKMDRSAAYAARHAAKNIVAAGLANKCEVSLSYAIGSPDPVAITVDTFDTGAVPDQRLALAISKVFDFSPDGIIQELRLRRPIYAPTAVYGHFSSDAYPWERIDAVGDLQKEI